MAIRIDFPEGLPLASTVLSARCLRLFPRTLFSRLRHSSESHRSRTRYGVPRTGWGGRIRTYKWRLQRPLPYHLATPQENSFAPQLVPRSHQLILRSHQLVPRSHQLVPINRVARIQGRSAPQAGNSRSQSAACLATSLDSNTPKTVAPLPVMLAPIAPASRIAPSSLPTGGQSRRAAGSRSLISRSPHRSCACGPIDPVDPLGSVDLFGLFDLVDPIE